MQIADPTRWLEDLQTRVADMQAKTTALAENLIASSATVSSKDGAVTVTVSPTGALENLELKARAAEMSPARLTASIMEAVRAAQRGVSEKVVEAFAPIGAGTEAMDLVLSFLPPEPDDEQDDDEPTGAFARPADDDQSTPQRPVPQATAPQPAPPAPPRPAPPLPAPKPARPTETDYVDPDNNPW
jgi:DNA-binding protein YbaB